MIKKTLSLMIFILLIFTPSCILPGGKPATPDAKTATEKTTTAQVVRPSIADQTATTDKNRKKTYHAISTHLALQSNQALSKLIEENDKINKSKRAKKEHAEPVIEINGTKVFYKEIPLTDLEMKPENVMSTKNMFNLPTYYQYGVGSAGFGAWRELFVNILATNWVLTDECENFALLYHWRVLPKKQTLPKDWVEKMTKRWGGSALINARLEALKNASYVLVLFLEYVPYTLDAWLDKELAKSDSAAQAATTMIEKDLKAVTTFMQSKNLLHFDLHSNNVLTDGKRLYVADFGLALSTQFELSKEEVEFFNAHPHYDFYEAIQTSLAMPIIDFVFKKNDVLANRDILQEFAQGKRDLNTLPTWATPIIARYARMSVIMINFYDKFIINDNRPLFFSKPIVFPSSELEKADKEGQEKLALLQQKK